MQVWLHKAMEHPYLLGALASYILIVYLLSFKVFMEAWKKTDSKIHRVWLARGGALIFFLLMPVLIPIMFLIACVQEFGSQSSKK
jgi:hypothetical protein